MNKKPEIKKIVFAPGCFDQFDGTQEELDELVAELHRLVESGEIFERSMPVDEESIDPEVLEAMQIALENDEDYKRKLN